MFPIDYQKLNLIYYPNKILRINCKPVDIKFLNTTEFFELCNFMKKITKKYDGIGLACPQIGINARIIYVSPNKRENFILVNPIIIETSKRQIMDSEGCLSLPQIFGNVIRPEKIIIQALNEYGEQIEVNADKIISRILQHEIDHLNGILFIDKAISITGGQKKLEQLQKK